MIEIKANELNDYKIVGEFVVPSKTKEDEDGKQKKVNLKFVVDTPLESILYDGFKSRKIAWQNKVRAKGFESIVDGSTITVAYVTAGKREVLDSTEKVLKAASSLSEGERQELIAKLMSMK
jgi:hypothetical protein